MAGTADIPGFLELGRRGFDCIRETLERNGTPIGGLKDVLDFGCGCGRVIRYWNGFAAARICGTDMNDYLIETCRRCVPFASVSTNSMAPKLDYANESFDLVYAFSVFTHLDVEAQKAWRDELRRILNLAGFSFFRFMATPTKGVSRTKNSKISTRGGRLSGLVNTLAETSVYLFIPSRMCARRWLKGSRSSISFLKEQKGIRFRISTC